jgi:hypothetical protein
LGGWRFGVWIHWIWFGEDDGVGCEEPWRDLRTSDRSKGIPGRDRGTPGAQVSFHQFGDAWIPTCSLTSNCRFFRKPWNTANML